MKRYFPLTMLLLAFVYFSTTGFQCGSAELTSAKLYMSQKQWQKAEESLMKELQKNDKNEEAWYSLGQVRLEMKKYMEMNDAFTHALAVNETHKADINRYRLGVWANMYNEGVGAYNKGKDSVDYYDRAVDNFKTAIAMEPDSAGTYYVASLAYYAKKDYKSVESNLESALKKKPDFGDAARFLGQLHYLYAGEKNEAKDSAGAFAEYGKAVKAFEIAYHAAPTIPENITNLIDAYDKTKESEKALALTSDAVQKDPTNKVYRYAYGVFLLKQDKFEPSVEQFKKAIEIDPAYYDAIYNCGVANLNWGVAVKAENDRKLENEKKGSKTKVKEDLSFKEKFAAALPYLEKSTEIRPDDALLWQQLARLYAILNMPDKSKTAFEKFDKLTKSK